MVGRSANPSRDDTKAMMVVLQPVRAELPRSDVSSQTGCGLMIHQLVAKLALATTTNQAQPGAMQQQGNCTP